MSTIFISYRRTDSKHATSRVYDRLRQEFGKGKVFKDVDSIPIGTDFRAVLKKVLGQCRVALVMIGPDWVKTPDTDGKPRILNPTDYVRLELEATLARGIPVVPVLLDGAAPPKPEDLPKSLHSICYRQAIVINDDPHFDDDIARLIRGLRKFVGTKPAEQRPKPPPIPKPKPFVKADVVVEAEEETEVERAEPRNKRPTKNPESVRRRRLGLGCVSVVTVAALLAVGLVLWNPVEQVREAARENVSRDNLKKIGEAMYKFADEHEGCLPAANPIAETGQFLPLSWRVYLLPYLGPDAAKLYQEFRLDRPWDDSVNLALSPRMPSVFVHPGQTNESRAKGETHYRVFLGKYSAFQDCRFVQANPIPASIPLGPKVESAFSDGTSNTILVVEATAAVPWTKPEGLAISARPLGPLGVPGQRRPLVLFADRETAALRLPVDDNRLRIALTASDGEVTDHEQFESRR